ncbi:MAG: hypothetical protein ACI4OV_05695 [Victivallaceae bacterium]
MCRHIAESTSSEQLRIERLIMAFSCRFIIKEANTSDDNSLWCICRGSGASDERPETTGNCMKFLKAGTRGRQYTSKNGEGC